MKKEAKKNAMKNNVILNVTVENDNWFDAVHFVFFIIAHEKAGVGGMFGKISGVHQGVPVTAGNVGIGEGLAVDHPAGNFRFIIDLLQLCFGVLHEPGIDQQKHRHHRREGHHQKTGGFPPGSHAPLIGKSVHGTPP